MLRRWLFWAAGLAALFLFATSTAAVCWIVLPIVSLTTDWKISAHPGDWSILDGAIELRAARGSGKFGHFEFARLRVSLRELGFPPGTGLRFSSISAYGGTVELHERLADGGVPKSKELLASGALKKKARPFIGVERLTFEDVRVYLLASSGSAQIGVRSLSVTDPGASHSTFALDVVFSGSTRDYRFAICPLRAEGVFLDHDRVHLNVRTDRWELYAFERRITLPAFRSEFLLADLSRNGFLFESEGLTADRAQLLAPALACEDVEGSYSGRVNWSGGAISVSTELNCAAKVLLCLGERFDGPFHAKAEASASFRPSTGRVALESLKALCDLGGGNRIMLGTEGEVAFVRKNGAYSFEPTGAKLKAYTSAPFDLTPYDRILPFSSEGLDLDLLYQIELTQETPKLRGHAAGGITDSRTHLKIFDFASNFSSEEISGIRAFTVTDCYVDLFSQEEELLHLDLSGKYDVATADLAGNIRYKLYDAAVAAGPKLEQVAELLKRAGLDQTRYDAGVQLHFDFPATLLSANVTSRVTQLPFFDRDGDEIPFDLNGFALFRVAPSGERYHVETVFRAQAEDVFDFTLDLSSGSSRQVRGLMALDRLDPMLAEQLLSRLNRIDLYPGDAGFTNGTMRMSFLCDPITLEGEIQELTAALEDEDGAVLSLTNDSIPIALSRRALIPEKASFSLSAHGLPLRKFGALLPPTPDFCFVDGRIDGSASIVLTELCRKAEVVASARGRDVSLLAHGDMLAFHRAVLNGRMEFDAAARMARLDDVCIDLYDAQEQEAAFACVNGTALLKDDFRTELDLTGVRFGPTALALSDALPEDLLHLDQLSTDGAFHYAARDRFAEQTLKGRLAIPRVRLQAEDPTHPLPMLNGLLGLNLRRAEKTLSGSAALMLSDMSGIPRFHLGWSRPEDAVAPPLIRSDALDLRMLTLLPWSDFPQFHFPDFTLRLALKRLFWGESPVEFSFCGPARFSGSTVSMPDMALAGFLNGTASLDLEFLPSGELGFALNSRIRDIALTPLIQTFGSRKNDNRLSGECPELSIRAVGAGFSAEAVRKTWNGRLRGRVKDVKFRNSIREDFMAINLVFLPLSVLPTLFDLVPFEIVRDPLVALIGGEYMKVLAGTRDVEFTDGTFDLDLADGVVNVRSLELSGPLFDSYTAAGSAELLTGTVNLRFMLQVAGLCWPVILRGPCANPEVEYAMFLPLFLKENSMRLVKHLPWLGDETGTQTPDDDEADAPSAEKPDA